MTLVSLVDWDKQICIVCKFRFYSSNTESSFCATIILHNQALLLLTDQSRARGCSSVCITYEVRKYVEQADKSLTLSMRLAILRDSYSNKNMRQNHSKFFLLQAFIINSLNISLLTVVCLLLLKFLVAFPMKISKNGILVAQRVI